MQSHTPKPVSEADTELDEDLLSTPAGPSSLSVQSQRRRFYPTVFFSCAQHSRAQFDSLVLHVQSRGESLTMNLWNQASTWEASIHCLLGQQEAKFCYLVGLSLGTIQEVLHYINVD